MRCSLAIPRLRWVSNSLGRLKPELRTGSSATPVARRPAAEAGRAPQTPDASSDAHGGDTPEPQDLVSHRERVEYHGGHCVAATRPDHAHKQHLEARHRPRP